MRSFFLCAAAISLSSVDGLEIARRFTASSPSPCFALSPRLPWSCSRSHVSTLKLKSPLLPRTVKRGVCALRSQRQTDLDNAQSDIEQAENAEKQVQGFVLKGLTLLALSLSTGYCLYSGQTPMEVIDSISTIDPQKLLQDSVDYIDQLGPTGYLYFSLIYVVAEMLAIPAIPLTASAGYLFGVVPGTCVVLVSATIAAGGAFLIGRVFLREWVEGLISKSRKFAAIDEAISRKGFQLVLLLRLSPLLPFALSNYLYGMTKVNFVEYLLGTIIGFAPGTLGFVLTGQVGREIVGVGEGGLPWYAYAGGLAAVLAIGKVVTGIASKAIEEVEAEAEMKRASLQRSQRGEHAVKEDKMVM
uniref:VTT domain-containing protein n=1 Tax=Guillardia theta TaxID=55529 RepID=A0A7S4KLV6_GUITH|mmetsp:Transcript_26945/g.88115  ORF Transcript_26945/g.88115 Transcript_26945/m.88115 type:complete len:358 (+) Transcript_26945:174-1247(+)